MDDHVWFGRRDHGLGHQALVKAPPFGAVDAQLSVEQPSGERLFLRASPVEVAKGARLHELSALVVGHFGVSFYIVWVADAKGDALPAIFVVDYHRMKVLSA